MHNNGFEEGHSVHTEPHAEGNYDIFGRLLPPKHSILKRPLSANPTVKLTKSNEFFKRTRIDSCSYVTVKNGIAQAIPFRPRPKQTENASFQDKTENQ